MEVALSVLLLVPSPGHSNDRPCSPAAWLPVPTHWSFPAPTLPGWTPYTQPCR